MRRIVETIIRECGESKIEQRFNSVYADLPLLKMKCLSEHLIKISNKEPEQIRENVDIIAILQLLKLKLKDYIYIDESDENLRALKKKLKKEFLDSLPQFNHYFRDNIMECNDCWDNNAEQPKTVKAYLAAILLIHAADVLLNKPVEQKEPLSIMRDAPSNTNNPHIIIKFIRSVIEKEIS